MTKGLNQVLSCFLFSYTFFLNTACAEEAHSPIPKFQHINQERKLSSESGKSSLMALIYEGQDSFGTACVVAISQIREKDESGVETTRHVAKVNYLLHGERPADTHVNFYAYHSRQNKYYAVASQEAGIKPVLASVLLNDKSIDVDMNELKSYEQQGLLNQFLRVEFSLMNIAHFAEIMKNVINDSQLFSKHLPELDLVEKVILKISHSGHYDSVACADFAPTEVRFEDFHLEQDPLHDHHH